MRSPYQTLNQWLTQRHGKKAFDRTQLERLLAPSHQQANAPDHSYQTRSDPGTTCVIIPVYNEAQNLTRTLAAVEAFLQDQPAFSFLFVDDGSKDATPDILQNFMQRQATPRLRTVHLYQNQGKGWAIKTGMLLADSDYVCFLDGDLAYSLNYLPQLVQALQTWDVVIGSRNLGKTPPPNVRLLRRIAGQIFNLLSRRIVNLDFPDMQAGIKGFRREVVAQINPRQTLMGFSFDVELLYLARKLGHEIGQIPVLVAAHHASKPSTVKLFQDSIQMLWDLVTIRWNDSQGKYD